MELASRASYRGQVTKLVNGATEYLKSDEAKIDENVSSLDTIEEELVVMLDRLTTAHDSLQKANIGVSSSIKPDDFIKEADIVAEYEDKAIAAITRLKHRLSKLRHCQGHSTPPENSTAIPAIATSSNASSGAVKLRKLQPRRFGGDFREWVPFWEQYRVLIHEDKSLTTIDKFNYLETALYGKAAETLVGLTPSEANYNTAINLLREEYGNNDKIVDHTMQRLLAIQPVASKSDVFALRRLYTSVLASTRSLAALGIPSTSYFVMLKGVLLRSLPHDLRLDFHRYYDDSAENTESSRIQDVLVDGVASGESVSEPLSKLSAGDKQVNCLLKYLKREVESLEKANEAKSNSAAHSGVSKQKPVKTAVGLFTAGSKENCLFCKAANHETRNCASSTMTLEQKKQLLREEGRCYRCCKKGHNSRMCKVKGIVCKTCNRRHATTLCDPSYKSISELSSQNGIETKAGKSYNSSSSMNLNTVASKQQDIYLQTACAYASSEHGAFGVFVRMILDGGSQLSFIKSALARRLNLPVIGMHNLSVLPFGSSQPKPSKLHNKVRMVLRSQYDDQAVILEAIEVPEICVDVLSIPTKDAAISVHNLALADARAQGQEPEEGISVLIGADTYWQFATGEHKRLAARLTAIRTVFGWTIQGPSSLQTKSSVHPTLNICACEEIQNVWRLDVLGIAPEGQRKVSQNLSLHIHRNGDRFEASLPWKDLTSTLHDNRTVALAQMQSLVRKLNKAGRLVEYDASMQEMLATGIAEIAPTNAINEKRVYYLPHHPVYREDKKTTRLRIVFNASSHAPNRLSLNDLLEVGPNLLPELLVILLNFRLGRIAIIADIEKAFLQILLHPTDKDSHRFLWFNEKIKNSRSLPPIQAYRMARLTFGVTSSPYILGATIQELLKEGEQQYEKTCKQLRKAFYMDDMILSVDEEETAIRIYQQASLIFDSASMKLRKWNSNSDFIRRRFAENGDVSDTPKVLGLRWIVAMDELEVDLDPVISLLKGESVQGTKRNVLKIMAKIFDPLGYLAPWTVRLKLLFQDIWRRKIGWDENLPVDLQYIWTACCNEINELNDMALPRHIKPSADSMQVHIFADASRLAFGAAAYARAVSQDRNVSVRFICAKGRIAPLKENGQNDLTIPRMELAAALIAARLLDYLRTNLYIKFNGVFLWTDSQIVLHWIQGKEKRWQHYVENRVKEIRALSDISSWRYCPGTENPADLLTRGISASSLLSSSIWRNGPSWLNEEPVKLPSSIKSNTVPLCVLRSMGEPNEGETLKYMTDHCSTPVLKAEKFSNWRRLLRVTAYVLRAVDAFKTKRHPLMKYLSAEEIDLAEKYWVKQVQRQHFREEIAALRQKKGILSHSKLISLSPFLDPNEEILRVGGRLQQVTLDENLCHPIILPKSSHITRLIIIDVHEKTFHRGPSAVLTQLRSKYWVIRGRQIIKNVTKNCFTCKVLRGNAATQVFAPLPRDRVLSSRPFEVTGVDFAGPLYIENGGQRRKVYILLFTCAAIRAIHLECTNDLTTESCLLAIRRFIARRGAPRILYSDNATTFKKTSSELSQLKGVKADERFLRFLSDSRIKWKFIVERAPWWGGFWERLIGVVKSALRTAVKKATLNADQLCTLLTEVEGVVNARPLTYCSDNPLDLSPLTPAHFLIGPFNTSDESCAENSTGKDLRKRWKERLRFLAAFKKRWFKEYLYQLRSLHHVKNAAGSTLQVGDVVLLEDSALPRPLWSLAVIKKLFPGRDGKVRACEIRLPSGSILRRPIQLLYPLEITSSN